MSIYHTIKKAFYPINQDEYKPIFLILILTISASFTEIVSIGLIIPILNLFVGNDYQNYSNYFDLLNLDNKNQILILILIIFALVHLLKFIMNRTLVFVQNKFSHRLYSSLAKKLYNDYINRDYIFFINKSSPELTRNILTECNIFSFGVIYHIISLMSEAIILITLITVLFFFNFQVSFIVIIYFGLIGFYFYKSNSIKLSKWGKERQFYSFKILKQLQESFTGFRELILNNLQQVFLKNFSIYVDRNANVGINRDNTLQIPRLVLELATILILILIVSYLLLLNYEIKDIFVLLGVFLYSAIRILPSTSKIIKSAQSLKNNSAVINVIFDQIKNLKTISIKKDLSKEKFEFKKIQFENLKFFYKQENTILENIKLEINKGDKIGLIGKSGSGKSTFINLFCALLKPIDGNILIDDKKISELIDIYQNEITYVPQKVTVFDESIYFNITLEQDLRNVDLLKLNKILKDLDLYETIYKLPNKIEEKAGENGSKFSGGQCQRIGIARALYKNTNILIFDEATNSLDFETEDKILNVIFDKYKDKTILLSTHRITSLKFCDIIYKIEDKNLKIENISYDK
jgi:ATP-binding cassette, subfamily B, bacterial PglK